VEHVEAVIDRYCCCGNLSDDIADAKVEQRDVDLAEKNHIVNHPRGVDAALSYYNELTRPAIMEAPVHESPKNEKKEDIIDLGITFGSMETVVSELTFGDIVAPVKSVPVMTPVESTPEETVKKQEPKAEATAPVKTGLMEVATEAHSARLTRAYVDEIANRVGWLTNTIGNQLRVRDEITRINRQNKPSLRDATGAALHRDAKLLYFEVSAQMRAPGARAKLGPRRCKLMGLECPSSLPTN